MKILVTGASGFIGSGVVARLSENKHDVYTLMRSSASSAFLKDVHFTRFTGDLLDPTSLERACQGMNAVIHLAGLTAAKNREEFFKFNAEGTRNLAHAALKAGTIKKFIYVSSLAASGPSPGLCPKTETDPDHPVSDYGESKLRGELFLDELKGKLPYLIIRPPMVYGPRDKNVFLFFQMISKNWMPILSSRTPTGHKYYSAIHVEDLIEAIVQALDAPDTLFATGEKLFISDGQIYTYERIMMLIADEMKTKPIRFQIPTSLMGIAAKAGTLAGKALNKNFVFNQDKLNELKPDYWICSPEKINQQLNFKAKYTMESGIAQTLAWYKINGWL